MVDLLKENVPEVFGYHSSSKDRDDRIPSQESLRLWQDSEHGVLLTTSIAAHGLNNLDVNLVMHLCFRSSVSMYIQEVSRMRWLGVAIQFIHPMFLTSTVRLSTCDAKSSRSLREMVHANVLDGGCRRIKFLLSLGDDEYTVNNCGNCNVCKDCVNEDLTKQVDDLQTNVLKLLTNLLVSKILVKLSELCKTNLLTKLNTWRRGLTNSQSNSIIMYLIAQGSIRLSHMPYNNFRVAVVNVVSECAQDFMTSRYPVLIQSLESLSGCA